VSRVFCTYFDQAYLARGLALIHSLERHARPFTLWVLCLDETTRRVLQALNLPEVRLLTLPELEAWEPRLAAARADRTRVEYYWTCTPSLVVYVLERLAAGTLVSYLDADLFFFSSPEDVYRECPNLSVLIHEHRFSKRQQHHLHISGIYNVGLIGFRSDTAGWLALRWWQEACLAACYMRPEEGYCGDQRYLDDWPQRFSGVHVLEHVGAGLAPWNQDQYSYSQQNGVPQVASRPLVFYHFHALYRLGPRLYAQRSFDVPRVLRGLVYRPYANALAHAEHETRQVVPDYSGPRNWPAPRQILSDLRHGRLMWL
jgi:hypothetical protein